MSTRSSLSVKFGIISLCLFFSLYCLRLLEAAVLVSMMLLSENSAIQALRAAGRGEPGDPGELVEP